MKTQSIKLMNKAVAAELHAINQYMYFHVHCEDQGNEVMAKIFKMVAIKEMIHVERFSERILFLKGDVIMNPERKIEIITDVQKMIEFSKQLEQETIENYNKWAKMCGDNEDATTKRLFEEILAEEEDHFDNFDIEIDNIAKFGDKYLALQFAEHAKNLGK
ncbi:bacterioferritin [Bacteroidales bacterium OttesenSCG-928-C19]|nr:bacterioferritin [Bacteroidales bacterium OttesenSCG-928-C19]